MSNLVTTVGIDISADVISANGSTIQNHKRVERLQSALQELLDNFEGKIWYGRARLASEETERGDFGY
jgi:hypothetical protein